MTDIFVESWGAGTPVVLVHGSLATGAEEWQARRPLAQEGYRLLGPPLNEALLTLWRRVADRDRLAGRPHV